VSDGLSPDWMIAVVAIAIVFGWWLMRLATVTPYVQDEPEEVEPAQPLPVARVVRR
jgi:hypothetical protein